MNKKDINPVKLINYYKLINHNLIYNNKAINRYKKDNFELSGDKAENLDKLKKSILSLNNCDLKRQAKNIVFSDGNPNSKIMLIGEAPGANEDEEGLPFVGRAGALLDKMLAAIDLDRKKVYISNIINYRPPDNRRPTSSTPAVINLFFNLSVRSFCLLSFLSQSKPFFFVLAVSLKKLGEM